MGLCFTDNTENFQPVLLSKCKGSYPEIAPSAFCKEIKKQCIIGLYVMSAAINTT